MSDFSIPRHWFGGWVRPGCLIAVAVVLGGALLVYRAIAVAWEAEYTLHANYLVLSVVTSHLERKDASWPHAWDDLVDTAPAQSWAMFKWPDDLTELKSRVKIDFSLMTADVAEMEPSDFTAIAPIGPHYSVHSGAVYELIQAARRASGTEKPTRTQREIEAAAIAKIMRLTSLRAEQLEAIAQQEGKDWRVLVTYLPATPGAHWLVFVSNTGEVKQVLGGA